MIDYAVPRTTYYSLAKDRLKEKHPMVYNLVLIFVLLTLIGTAAFLISDILSFVLDYDNENIQIDSGLPGPGKSNIFTSLWDGNKENRSPMEDIEPKLGLKDGLLTANSSPKMSMNNSMASNSTGKDEMAKTTEELNSSDPSQSRSAISQAMSTTTTNEGVHINQREEIHRSSSSSSKSSSEEKESEETAAGSNNESTNNTAANNTAANETSITRLPGSLSIKFPNANETGIVQHHINSSSVGPYRNESPQKIKGAKPESSLDEGKSERTEKNTTQEKQGNLNSLDSYRPQEESAQAKSASYSYFESDNGSIQEMPSAVQIGFNGAKASETVSKSVPNLMPANPGTSASMETLSKTDTSAKAAIPEKVHTPAQVQAPAKAKMPDKTQTPAQVQTTAKAEMPAKTQTPTQVQTTAKDQMPAKIQTPVQVQTPAKDQMPDKIQTPVQVQTTAKAKMPDKTQTPVQVQSTAKAMMTDKTQSTAQVQTTAKAKMPDKTQTPVQVQTTAKAEMSEKTQTPVQVQTPAKSESLRENDPTNFGYYAGNLPLFDSGATSSQAAPKEIIIEHSSPPGSEDSSSNEQSQLEKGEAIKKASFGCISKFK